jgi:hypothetical protein
MTVEKLLLLSGVAQIERAVIQKDGRINANKGA